MGSSVMAELRDAADAVAQSVQSIQETFSRTLGRLPTDPEITYARENRLTLAQVAEMAKQMPLSNANDLPFRAPTLHQSDALTAIEKHPVTRTAGLILLGLAAVALLSGGDK